MAPSCCPKVSAASPSRLLCLLRLCSRISPSKETDRKGLLAHTPKHLLVEGKCAFGGILQQLSEEALEAASVSFAGCRG